MNLNQRINTAIKDPTSLKFLEENKDVIRENILVAQKRITRFTILILVLIAICELLISKSISSISLMGTEINFSGSSLLIIILPTMIAYFWLTLNRQYILLISLKRLFTKIIRAKNPQIVELDIDDFLITQMEDSVEDILTSGKTNWFKKTLIILSIIISVIFRFTPILYCIYIYHHIFINEEFNQKLFLTSLLFAIFFFIRALFLNINASFEIGLFDSNKNTNESGET